MPITVNEMLVRNEGKLPSYAWPGGYDIAYHLANGQMVCGECAQEILAGEQFGACDKPRYVEYTALWSEPKLCEHCGRLVGPEREEG